MGESSIEWTDATWNPVRGCSRVSPGCDNCYAMRQAHRFNTPSERSPYHGLTTIRKGKADWTGTARFVPVMLDAPLYWKKPRRIFVNSMSDLFHHDVTNEQIAAVFGVMALAGHHQFQCLTKRPDRMRDFFAADPVAKIAAWLQDVMHDERANPTLQRAIRDRFGWDDMARGQAPRTRRETGRRVLQRSHHKPVSSGEGGVPDAGRLLSGHCNDQGLSACGWSASACVDTSQRAYPRRPDDQPQGRNETEQHGVQSGTGYDESTATTRLGCSERETAPANRQQTPQDASDGGGCNRNAAPSFDRNDDQGHRGALRDEAEGCVRYLQPEDLAARLTWPLPNVWLGVSCEDQQRADERIPLLLQVPAAVRFVSAEPLLGATDFAKYLAWTLVTNDGRRLQRPGDAAEIPNAGGTWERGLDLVIVGGESGPGARPCNVEWIRSIVRQCKDAGTAAFVKQLGAVVVDERHADIIGPSGAVHYTRPASEASEMLAHDPKGYTTRPHTLRLHHKKGGDMAEFPEDLRVRELPETRS